MTRTTSKPSRIFFWQQKKTQQKKPVRQENNLTIAAFWQAQLENIANDNSDKKGRKPSL